MPYLEIATPDGIRVMALARERLTLGRLKLNDVMLPYAQISRQHAEVARVQGEWWIRDLGSTNGLHIGEQRVREHRLEPGVTVLLAPDIGIRFVVEGAATPDVPGDSLAAFGAIQRETLAPEASRSALPAGPLVAGGSANDHYRRTMPAQRPPAASALLHTCQTCGQRTAPDVAVCSSCHQSIARPCTTCGRELLPIDDRCPRCQTSNPLSVRRAQRRAGG